MKKGKLLKFFSILILIYLILSNVSTILNDFVETFKFQVSNLNSDYINHTIRSFATYTNLFRHYKETPYLVSLILIGFYILSFVVAQIGLFKEDDRYRQTEEYGSHGTARWQTLEETKDYYYRKGHGWFLGSIKEEQFSLGVKAARHVVENKANLNMQVTVIGPPGSNKTTGLVLPTIFDLVNTYVEAKKSVKAIIDKSKILHEQYNEGYKKVIPWVYDKVHKKSISKDEMPDLIITDPKPELYIYTSNYLIENGYDLVVFDFIDLMYGDSLNILDFIEDDKTLMQIAKSYIDSVDNNDDGGSKGDQQFWNDQEAQVLAALIGFVKQKYPKERQNLAEVSKILTSDDVADIDSARYFFQDNEITGAALQLWNNFLMLADSDRTRANILGGLAEKLKLFAIQGVRNITSKSTVDIRKLGAKKDKPIAMFILIPDDDRTFAPIINTFITITFKQLYKTARKTRARLENPVYYILEEMANIGKIPNIKQMLGGMRGRRIYPMMIWQSLAQMEERYGTKGYKDIMSMCDTQIFLGINDNFTATSCSDDLGFTTIKVQGTNNKADSGLLKVDQKSESNSYAQRKLMFPDECKNLDNRKMILIQRSLRPVILYKTQYKYWENEICEPREVDELPMLESYDSEYTYSNENEFVGNHDPSNAVNNITLADTGEGELPNSKEIEKVEDEIKESFESDLIEEGFTSELDISTLKIDDTLLENLMKEDFD